MEGLKSFSLQGKTALLVLKRVEDAQTNVIIIQCDLGVGLQVELA